MLTARQRRHLLLLPKLTVALVRVEHSVGVSAADCVVASISHPTPFLTQSSTSASTSNSSSPRLTLERIPGREVQDGEFSIDPSSKDFVSRVSRLPVVNSALKAYEQTKERSRMVKVQTLILPIYFSSLTR